MCHQYMCHQAPTESRTHIVESEMELNAQVSLALHWQVYPEHFWRGNELTRMNM